MLISHSHKVIFVHIQKTGGITVETILRQHIPDIHPVLPRHAFAKQGKAIIPDWDDYFSFAFVRNPWDRLVSWYSMIREAKEMTWWDALCSPRKRRHFFALRRGRRKYWQYVLENSTSFDEFIRFCGDDIEVEPGIFVSIYRNQLDYLTDEDGTLLVDFIGRFENFASDLAVILNRLGIQEAAIPHENRSKHRHYSLYYTPETRELVSRIYARDIETFGYHFESRIET